MTLRRQALRLLATAALAVGLLAACGDDGGTPPTTGADDADADATTGADDEDDGWDGDVGTDAADTPGDPADVGPDAGPTGDAATDDTGGGDQRWSSGMGAVWEEPPVCEPPPAPMASYQATIRFTSYGIPHVEAATVADAAFAQGWLHARDHGCVVLDQILMVRSQRARWLGAGDDDEHVERDLAYLAMGLQEAATCGLGDLDDEARGALFAYAAGFNDYLAEHGLGALSPDCAGEAWAEAVGEVTAVDLLAHELRLSLVSSGDLLWREVARAQPPAPRSGALPVQTPSSWPAAPRVRSAASNGWAIGFERSATGGGMLLANPHLPYEGDLRLHEIHLTIPGDLDAYGASFIGTPGLWIGFNRDVAWTHTVTASTHFTIHSLILDALDVQAYLLDDVPTPMTRREHTVEVLGSDGTVDTVSRTLYRSVFGPIMDFQPVGWSEVTALSYTDAGLSNLHALTQRLAMMRAGSVDDLEAAHAHRGLAWMNTVAVDRAGHALYMDGSRVPAMSDEALAAWAEKVEAGDPFTYNTSLAGVFTFPGDRTAMLWEPGDDGSGLVPLDDAPVLVRNDYVFNANDSHWLSHLLARMSGFSPLYGPEETARSLRTRLNLKMLTEAGPGTTMGDDWVFDLAELEAGLFEDRMMIFELVGADALARCEDPETVTVDDVEHDPTAACAAVLAWDGRADPASAGAVVWREALTSYLELVAPNPPFIVPFDPLDPIGTPGQLAPSPPFSDDPVLQAMALAAERLAAAGLAPDVPLGDVQTARRGDDHFPIGGASEQEGAFNVNSPAHTQDRNATALPETELPELLNPTSGLTVDGTYPVLNGASWVLVLAYEGDDDLTARAVMSYGQSDDPASPHFADQTELLSQQTLRPVLFDADAIAADPELSEITITGSSDPG